MFEQETLDSFEQLYQETYPDVMKYVVCHCSNIEDTKDIVQNIYLHVFKNQKRIPIGKAKKYILGISKYKVKDYYRFRYKEKMIAFFSHTEDSFPVESIPDSINIEASMLERYDINQVWEYLKRRPVIISKVFYLYYYLELTIKEIAQELHVSESSVKNYLYRSLQELRIHLEKEEEENG